MKHLYSKLNCLLKVFYPNNGYPYWLINRVFEKVQDNYTRQQTLDPFKDTAVLNDVRKQSLLLPHAGQNRCTLINSLKTHLKKILPSNVKADIVYTEIKLSGTSNVADKTSFQEQQDLLYRAVCATNKDTEDSVGTQSGV